MLIKIGSALVDPAEIVAIKPYPDHPATGCEGAVQICITLRTAPGIWTDATMDEAEAALIDAGVMTDLTAGDDEPPLPDMDDEEMEQLVELHDNGYNYLARDKDGKLFAYMNKPTYDGAYWDDHEPVFCPKLIGEGFSFIGETDKEPVDIHLILSRIS